MSINNKEKLAEDFYSSIFGSEKVYTMAQVASDLNLDISDIFEFLRKQGIFLIDNQPNKELVDKGYFSIVTARWTDSNTGYTNITLKTMVFQTGLDYIRKEVAKHYYKP